MVSCLLVLLNRQSHQGSNQILFHQVDLLCEDLFLIEHVRISISCWVCLNFSSLCSVSSNSSFLIQSKISAASWSLSSREYFSFSNWESTNGHVKWMSGRSSFASSSNCSYIFCSVSSF